MRETSLETSRPEKKEQEEVLQTQSRDSPAVKTMVMLAVPMQPMEDHGKVDIHTTVHGGPQAEAGSWQERHFHRGRSFLAVTVASCGSSILLKGSTSLKGTHSEAFHERLSPMEGCHAGVGEEHREEGVIFMKDYELTTTTIPAPRGVEGIAGVKKLKELGGKSNLRAREGRGNLGLVFFLFLRISKYPILLQAIDNKFG